MAPTFLLAMSKPPLSLSLSLSLDARLSARERRDHKKGTGGEEAAAATPLWKLKEMRN
jgi:hypothetical protein